MSNQFDVEDTIENGVKYIFPFAGKPFDEVNGVVQNGVKDTKLKSGRQTGKVDDTIQNGVKRTTPVKSIDTDRVGGEIKIERRPVRDYPNVIKMMVEDTIENGEKIELK
jgi:hypothetical protein